MPWLPKSEFLDWPKSGVDLTPEKVQELYTNGFAGAKHDPAAIQRFQQLQGWSDGEDAVRSFGMQGNGAGKLVAPFVHVLEMFPGCWPGPAQEIGDCLLPGTKVKMRNGTEKNIENVKKGEIVLSHIGNARKVTRTIVKEYDGDVVKVLARRNPGRFIDATVDHKFWAIKKDKWTWVAIEKLGVGDTIGVVPIGQSVISKVVRRSYKGKVYCLEVEKDHSFIANGFFVSNCVSHATKNASLLTMVCDVVSSQPDEKTGKVEGKPDVPDEGIRNGVLSSEAYYWWRGYDDDGWSCHDAANVATKISGLFIRQNYPDIGVDLTKYSGRLAHLYGSKKPPNKIKELGQQHLIHQATEAETVESIRDLLFNGYGVSSCGGEGFSNKRNEHGVSNREGNWAHAIPYIAVDDRDVIKKIYNDTLVLLLNSWNIWNSGPRDIYQSAELVPAEKRDLWIALGIVNPDTGNIMIPEGSFWARWKDVSRRESIAFSGANGWPRKQLPDWGTGGLWG